MIHSPLAATTDSAEWQLLSHTDSGLTDGLHADRLYTVHPPLYGCTLGLGVVTPSHVTRDE